MSDVSFVFKRAATLEDVTCPYCNFGWATISVEVDRQGSKELSKTVRDLREPRQCNTCGKFFKLMPKVTIHGVKLED